MDSLTAKETWKRLKAMQDVYILIHRSPDGDCIGGGYALHWLLRGAGIRSRVCCADPIPALYHCITEGVTFEDFISQHIVSVDVADRKLFGTLAECSADCAVELAIDHHISNTGYAQAGLWHPEASAACEVLYEMMRENQLPMTQQLALCLYVGIATDTGCFKFDNAGAEAFAAVAEIKRQFPDLPYARLNRALFDLKSRGRIQMDARLMQTVQCSADGRVALLYLPHDWLAELQVEQYETDGIANLPMQMMGVEIGITVKAQADGSYRVSMRAGDQADVSAVCQRFGGGGHVKASGCHIHDGAPEAVCAMLMQAAEAVLNGTESA